MNVRKWLTQSWVLNRREEPMLSAKAAQSISYGRGEEKEDARPVRTITTLPDLLSLTSCVRKHAYDRSASLSDLTERAVVIANRLLGPNDFPVGRPEADDADREREGSMIAAIRSGIASINEPLDGMAPLLRRLEIALVAIEQTLD